MAFNASLSLQRADDSAFIISKDDLLGYVSLPLLLRELSVYIAFMIGRHGEIPNCMRGHPDEGAIRSERSRTWGLTDKASSIARDLSVICVDRLQCIFADVNLLR